MHAQAQLIFDTPVYKAGTVLLSQRLKPPIQFKSSILLSGCLLRCGSFQICALKQHTELSV